MYNFGLFSLLVAAFVQCAKIHEQMSDEEIANFFHTHRDNVPEYEVASVRHNLYKRSGTKLRLQFNAFGKEINAYLEPSDGVLAGRNTPVWLASTKPDGTVEYIKLRDDLVGIVAGFFNSPIDLSTVIAINAKGDNATFEGIVSGMMIRSLPERFQELAKSRREVQSTETSRTLLGTRLYVILKPTSSLSERKDIKDLERQILKTRSSNETDHSQSKRSIQDIIFPSIMISTDFAQSKTSQNDLAYYNEIIYQLAFWNAVDLRFRQVTNPKIRLRIAGIIIGLDRGANPYMYEYRTEEGEVWIEDAWPDMENYWTDLSRYSSDFPLEAYNIVVTMTDSYLIGPRSDGSVGHLEGIARIGSLCDRWNNGFFALVAVRDIGGFWGVLAASHELGHVMGLTHDESNGDECDESHHFIMQPDDYPGPNNLRWSACSLKRLSQLLRENHIDCVDEPATVHPPGPSVQRFLPGDVVNTHQQCQSRGYHWACDTNSDTCTAMSCYYTGWSVFQHGWWCKKSGPAAEGTTCSPDGHKCVNGVCQCLSDECIFDKIP